MAAWRDGMARRGFPDARIILWGKSYCYVKSVYPDPRIYDWCTDDADAVFLAIEHLRPPSVRPRPSLRKLLAAHQ